MLRELPKTFDPHAVEAEIYQLWLNEKCFSADPSGPGDPYAIVIPPPNVTAALHLGHALNNTIQDILTRQHRMMGNNAVWLPGTDHAGIATQTVVEKRVLAEEGKRRADFQRDEFVARIQAWKDQYEKTITDQLKAMGCSCDWDRQAFTMDEPRATAVREAFFRLFKDGLIYRGKRLVNWDPATLTALADDEVEMEEIDGFFYYLKYPLTDGSGTVTVATTRPETMLGDTAVAINPKDPRAAGLRGKTLRLPIVGREIPIIEDDYVLMPDPEGDDPKAKFATGFLKVTPAHDPNDYEIGLRHNLPVINVMAPDASISNQHGWTDVGEAGFVLGKPREEARQLIVDWFKQHDLLEEVRPYRHAVGHSYRSHVPIEPYLSDQWYCKVTDDRLRGAALRAMSPEQREDAGRADSYQSRDRKGVPQENDPSTPPLPDSRGSENTALADEGLRFYPARYAKTFQTWHENIRDWCISRQLWWGHRIPVWRRTPTSRMFPDSLIGHIARETLYALQAKYPEAMCHITLNLETGQLSQNKWLDPEKSQDFVCLKQDIPEVLTELTFMGFEQDPDVLDTWFSSALWPMSTLNWPSDTLELREWNPSSVLCTAREIITLWVSRMVMFNLYFRDCLPFTDVFIHAMIQDGEGQKMSKSLGNGVDPLDIIASHGADAMRYTLAAMTTHTQDLRMPVEVVDPHSGIAFVPEKITTSTGYVVAGPIQSSPKNPKLKMVSSFGQISGQAKPTAEKPVAKNTSTKFDLGRNFCNKLWNAARFALSNLQAAPMEMANPSRWSLADRWIISRLQRTIGEVDDALGDYRFDVYAKSCYDFFWRDLCDWYVEAIKPAMKDPQRVAQTANVLAAVLDGSLRLLHPVIPFITEALWGPLNDVRPLRGLPGYLVVTYSDHLITASWPTWDTPVEAEDFGKLQELIGAVRNLRNSYNVKPSNTVDVSVQAPADLTSVILENRELIESLAICSIKQAGPNVTAPAQAARTAAVGCEIFVEGLADPQAERQRAAKQRDDLTRQVNALRGRLTNESYISKAPPHLVQQTRDQLATAEAELSKMG